MHAFEIYSMRWSIEVFFLDSSVCFDLPIAHPATFPPI